MIPPPQQPEYLSRRPPSSSHRRRNSSKKSNDSCTPKLFWERNKSIRVVECAIGLCCSTYLGQLAAEWLAEQGHCAFHDWMQRNFVNSAGNILAGRLWVLLSSSLAHNDLVHLAINMVAFWDWEECMPKHLEHLTSWAFGYSLQSPVPQLRPAGILSKEGLRMKTSAFGPHYEGSIGAFGITCGLIGYFLYIMPEMQMDFMFCPMSLRHNALLLVAGSAFCIVTGLIPFVAHAGHLGGFAAGIAYYYGVVRLWPRISRRR